MLILRPQLISHENVSFFFFRGFENVVNWNIIYAML